ncbi:uncharacterized protein CXorf38 homolog [Spea bombifrons]|uniref:uncharacterized protein CXorf38 homolog n=1 Tax=Spea bombifrons TaxID=233779 RepID=UPI00234BD317|nr:uncharacterized protein CXorf38 homolog [Spea bombifrons]
MAMRCLLSRLNCKEYKNWIKAGYCLSLLKSSLQTFIESEMKSFHQRLCREIPQGLPRTRCQCKARGKQFNPACPVCVEWKKIILKHHTNKNGEIHWGNCKPSLWPTNYWEVAKVYMPRGHADTAGPQLCDAAALLNLINACDRFREFNQSKVREVIKCRNELMHSSDMNVSSNWLKDFGQRLQNLIFEFRHVPGIHDEGKRIQEVLKSDWLVEDFGYEVDGLVMESTQTHEEIPMLIMYETEQQLIQQLLKEIYLQIEEQVEEQESLSEKDFDSVQKVKAFLSEHVDLQSNLQATLEKLDILQRTHVSLEGEGCP